MALADRLKAYREARGWKVPELARESGVGHPQIYRIESGAAPRPSYETLTKLATALQVEVRDLIAQGEWDTAPLADADTAALARLVEGLQLEDAPGFLRTLASLAPDDQEAVADMARRLARRPPARILGSDSAPPRRKPHRRAG